MRRTEKTARTVVTVMMTASRAAAVKVGVMVQMHAMVRVARVVTVMVRIARVVIVRIALSVRVAKKAAKTHAVRVAISPASHVVIVLIGVTVQSVEIVRSFVIVPSVLIAVTVLIVRNVATVMSAARAGMTVRNAVMVPALNVPRETVRASHARIVPMVTDLRVTGRKATGQELIAPMVSASVMTVPEVIVPAVTAIAMIAREGIVPAVIVQEQTAPEVIV